MAKGQALSSAVMVVEGVLHKMEEQVRYWAASSSSVLGGGNVSSVRWSENSVRCHVASAVGMIVP